jgi:glycosyltransferase involved in cell wall biosynthesis
MLHIVYASFDEVPSFKAASTHILANCRKALHRHRLELLTLGETALPAHAGFLHRPAALREKNYLKRGLAFREFVGNRLRRERPDVFHFRTPWEGLAAAELRVPSVYEVNGLPSIELPYLYRDAGERVLDILRGWEQACLERAHAIVCPSERIRECLLRRYRVPDPDRIWVIPNGYDPPGRIAESGDNPQPGGRALQNPLRAVYLGTLHPWQGILWALQAFASLEGRCTLDIYGVGARQWLAHGRKRIARYGLENTVRLHPPVDRSELSEVLAGYDLGLAPLLKTGRNAEQGCCPVKIMDYLAHGLPVVASDLTVVRALVEHGGNGLLHPPNCRAGFAAALAELHERRVELPDWRRRARASLARFPTWDQVSERMLDIYEQIARSARR